MPRFALLPAVAGLLLAAGARAQSADASWWERWQQCVSETQAAQPRWVTPVVTVTPRLEQEFRYDIAWQLAGSTVTAAYGGKGLELIPARAVEVILTAPPAYVVHSGSTARDGFGDWGFLVKYRLWAANEQHGNGIVTLLFSGTLPTGQYANGLPAATWTPALGYGKGWGHWDQQGTLGLTLPTSHLAAIGRTLSWNHALQYHLGRYGWPELEVNLSHFLGGPHDGQTQVYLTPGLVLGRFPLRGRLGLTVGAGAQIAVSSFYTAAHRYVLTVRLPF
jgi:hypothetical protein